MTEREELQACATEVLGLWITGPSDPFSDGMQRRVVILDTTPDRLLVRCQKIGEPDDGREYVIRLDVRPRP